MFRQFAGDLFEDYQLASELVLDDRRVDIDALTMPVAIVIGSADSYLPRDVGLPFLRVVASADTRALEMPTGRVGTFVHAGPHETYWPRVCERVEPRT